MQAIQGFYDNGAVKLDKQAPIRKGKIIMLFPGDEITERYRMSDSEAIHLFHKYTGSIKRDIDVDKERDEYFDEKFGPFD